jgi:Asp-tRNA(Asn)/Glu-tRNA(Gln) amidotransferase A subunit family amidase
MNRLLNADACEQAAAVRAGNVTAAELVHAAIARIEARNPRINAVIIERFTDAVAEADSASGPFAGYQCS